MLLRNMRLAPLTHASARPPTVFIPATPPTARLPSLRFAASFGSAACRAASTATPAAVAMPPITRVDGPWEGLQAYRAAPRDLRWTWGKRGVLSWVRACGGGWVVTVHLPVSLYGLSAGRLVAFVRCVLKAPR